jgi:hypothetical protein
VGATASRASLEQAQHRAARERALLIAERESRYLMSEMRRVVMVTSACLGLLAVLAVVQRLA